jgi:hypothetical protein
MRNAYKILVSKHEGKGPLLEIKFLKNGTLTGLMWLSKGPSDELF